MPRGLDDVQREAAGRGVQQLRVGVGQRAAGIDVGQPRRVGGVQRASVISVSGPRGAHPRGSSPPARESSVRGSSAQRWRDQQIGASASRPRQNGRKASVSSSHHCRLSSTSSIGRPTPSSARASPSKKRCRCQASTMARARTAGAPRSGADGHQPLDLGAPHRLQRRDGGGRSAGCAQPVRHRREREPPGTRRSTGPRRPRRRPAVPGRASSATSRVLPTPGVTADQHDGRAARRPRRASASAAVRAPLRGPRAAPRPARSARAGGRAAAAGAAPARRQPAQRRARVASSGLDAQLALQHGGAAVVGAHGPGAVAQIGLDRHQRAVARLLERAPAEPAAGRPAAPRPSSPPASGSRRPGRTARRTRSCSSARTSSSQSSYRPGSSSPR